MVLSRHRRSWRRSNLFSCSTRSSGPSQLTKCGAIHKRPEVAPNVTDSPCVHDLSAKSRRGGAAGPGDEARPIRGAASAGRAVFRKRAAKKPTSQRRGSNRNTHRRCASQQACEWAGRAADRPGAAHRQPLGRHQSAHPPAHWRMHMRARAHRRPPEATNHVGQPLAPAPARQPPVGTHPPCPCPPTRSMGRATPHPTTHSPAPACKLARPTLRAPPGSEARTPFKLCNNAAGRLLRASLFPASATAIARRRAVVFACAHA